MVATTFPLLSVESRLEGDEVIARFVVVAFVAIRLVKNPATVLNTEEKKLVDVAFVVVTF